MKCEECKFDYPSELLYPSHSSEGALFQICGICALEISNRVTGFKRERFTGMFAEAMRQAAIKWREEHPPNADA